MVWKAEKRGFEHLLASAFCCFSSGLDVYVNLREFCILCFNFFLVGFYFSLRTLEGQNKADFLIFYFKVNPSGLGYFCFQQEWRKDCVEHSGGHMLGLSQSRVLWGPLIPKTLCVLSICEFYFCLKTSQKWKLPSLTGSFSLFGLLCYAYCSFVTLWFMWRNMWSAHRLLSVWSFITN